MQPYWSFRDDTAIIDRTAMKSIIIIVPAALQANALYLNHMDIKRTGLLVYESIYQVNTNANIKEMIKNCPMCLDF